MPKPIIREGTDKCPYCLAQHVEDDLPEVFQNDDGEGGVSQNCWCLTCEKHWTDYYVHTLTLMEEPVPADQEVAMKQ